MVRLRSGVEVALGCHDNAHDQQVHRSRLSVPLPPSPQSTPYRTVPCDQRFLSPVATWCVRSVQPSTHALADRRVIRRASPSKSAPRKRGRSRHMGEVYSYSLVSEDKSPRRDISSNRWEADAREPDRRTLSYAMRSSMPGPAAAHQPEVRVRSPAATIAWPTQGLSVIVQHQAGPTPQQAIRGVPGGPTPDESRGSQGPAPLRRCHAEAGPEPPVPPPKPWSTPSRRLANAETPRTPADAGTSPPRTPHRRPIQRGAGPSSASDAPPCRREPSLQGTSTPSRLGPRRPRGRAATTMQADRAKGDHPSHDRMTEAEPKKVQPERSGAPSALAGATGWKATTSDGPTEVTPPVSPSSGSRNPCR